MDDQEDRWIVKQTGKEDREKGGARVKKGSQRE